MSARFSLKITTLCHSVRSRGSPDWRSFQRSEVAIRRLTIFWSLWLWRTSGSRPRLPTRITLFTLPAIACSPFPREASPDPACPSRRWAREPPVPVKRGRAYQELLASNSECRRPLRLPREGRRQGQAGGERRPHGAEAGRRHSAGRPLPAVHEVLVAPAPELVGVDPERLGGRRQGLAALRQPLDRLALVLGGEPAPLPRLHPSFPVLVGPTLRRCPSSRGRLNRRGRAIASVSGCPRLAAPPRSRAG